MKAEILTIGDEILIGQITNTNSVWIAQQLNLIGIKVVHMASVADDEDAIIHAFDEAAQRADIVLVTGGLGPTKDDITKKTFAKYLDCQLVIDEEVLLDVTSFFAKRGKPLTELNRQQAMVPENCSVIRNPNGTAPGMWMKKGNTVFVSMPGVPYEMKAMVTNSVLPRINKENKLPFIYHKTILTQGIGESALAELIEKWEDDLASKNIKLAYLPQPGMVRLRLSVSGMDEAAIKKAVENEIEKLLPLIKQYVYGYENYGEETPSLQKIISELLRSRNKTLSLAESCTGGHIATLFTAIPGASDIFKGGVVPYTNEAKQALLGVKESVFSSVGAVSRECVEQLACNAILKFKSDYALAVSGVAGPSGGSADKPVGFVWVAVADSNRVVSKQFQFGDNRERNIVMTGQAAMNLLRKFILEETV